MWKLRCEKIHLVSKSQGKWNGNNDITRSRARIIKYLFEALKDFSKVLSRAEVESRADVANFLCKAFPTFDADSFEDSNEAVDSYEFYIKGTCPDRLAWALLECLDTIVAFDLMQEEVQVVHKTHISIPSFKNLPEKCIYSIIENFIQTNSQDKAFSVLIQSILTIGKELGFNIGKYLVLAYEYHKTPFTREGRF